MKAEIEALVGKFNDIGRRISVTASILQRTEYRWTDVERQQFDRLCEWSKAIFDRADELAGVIQALPPEPCKHEWGATVNDAAVCKHCGARWLTDGDIAAPEPEPEKVTLPDFNNDVAVLTDWANEVERYLRPPSEHGTHPEYALEYTERTAKLRALRNAIVALQSGTADTAALRAQIAQLQQKIREAHDLVSRKGQADNHDFAGCLIDGILNLKEGLSLCATERDAAEAALSNLYCWLDERRNAPDVTTLGMIQRKILELQTKDDK
jgi:hypothetical protein